MIPMTPEEWRARIDRLLLNPAFAEVLAELLIAEGEPPLTDEGLEDALRVMREGGREARLRELAAAYSRGEIPEGDPRREELTELLR